MLKRISSSWAGLALGLLLLLLPLRAVHAMEMAIPEEIQKLPPEQQAQWLNQQFQAAATLQKKVAQERFDAREEARLDMIRAMNEASASREQQIADARETIQERQEEAAQEQSIASGLLGAMLIVFLAAWLYKRRRQGSEPVAYY